MQRTERPSTTVRKHRRTRPGGAGSRYRRLAAVLTLALALPVAISRPAHAAALPGGKANYVVSLLAGPVNAMAVRLATYQFSADGTVVERYWSWRQNSITGKGNTRWSKPPSGYTTSGCRHTCPIRTPVGFQSGRAGLTHQGRWSMEPGGTLAISWGGPSVERWSLDTSVTGMVGARLVSSGSARGWAIGSNAPLTQAVDMAAIYAARRLYGPLAQNAYGRPTEYRHIGFHAPDYTLCKNGRCMQGVGNRAADKRTWFSSYWAANPAVDGRKVYWNNQTGAVQQVEQPGGTCISASGGGHTDALLQGLDDSGRLVGVVGVEASLNQRKTGQAVVGAFVMVVPSALSTVN